MRQSKLFSLAHCLQLFSCWNLHLWQNTCSDGLNEHDIFHYSVLLTHGWEFGTAVFRLKGLYDIIYKRTTVFGTRFPIFLYRQHAEAHFYYLDDNVHNLVLPGCVLGLKNWSSRPNQPVPETWQKKLLSTISMRNARQRLYSKQFVSTLYKNGKMKPQMIEKHRMNSLLYIVQPQTNSGTVPVYISHASTRFS